MNSQNQSTKTIDVSVQTLFTKFDRGHEGHLTRIEIADILTDIFTEFGLNNPVTEEDVHNFLLDYDITHRGDLTRKDFEGVTKLRFILHLNNTASHSQSSLSVHLPSHPVQVTQIIVPVQMLFDIFNRRHDGHLTKVQIGQVINLIYKDFHIPYTVTQKDVENFLEDFDINHDREITTEDFNGVDILHFDLHHGHQMKIY